jgi:hypothetical protein
MRKPTLKSLRKKAWKLHSELVRRYEKGICYTCGIKKPWKQQNAGHYIHKDCLDFDSVNIHCQCVRCNKWLNGNSGIYAERLIAEYGENTIIELRQRSNQVRKFGYQEMEDLIIKYQAQLKTLNNS